MQEASKVHIRRSSGKPMFCGVEGRSETWPALILASHNTYTASQQQGSGRSFSTSKNGVLFAVDNRPGLGHCEWIVRRNWGADGGKPKITRSAAAHGWFDKDEHGTLCRPGRMEHSKQFSSISVLYFENDILASNLGSVCFDI